MNRHKLLILVFICVILVLGFFMFKSKEGSWANPSSSTQVKEGDAVITEGAKEEARQESYASGISLMITSPQAGATVTSPTLTVKGKTGPNADVFVNDRELKADSAGNFSATITLDEGENAIIVVANDSEGNSAEQQILVTLEY